MNIFAILCFILHTGVQGFLQEQWLPCRLWDVHVWKKNDGQTESKYVQKDVVLQFASSGDSALYPDSITFLVGASKVDMRKYVEGPVDQLRCEIHRYSKGMSRVRWPSLGGTEHDIWFTCTLRHIAGLFNITSYLRVTPATTMSPHQPDFHSWVTLAGKDKLRASAVMVLRTRSPSVWVGLQEKQTLHCEFAVDHEVSDLTVEWHLDPFRRRRTRLFRYSRRSGQTEGSGVAVNGIARGTASLTVPLTGRNSEGTYWCSVQVPPLNGSLAIGLHIMVPPSVSMTIEQSLIPRVVCKADRYYPMEPQDVDIELFKETGNGERPKKLENVTHLSHITHPDDGTITLSAYVLLRPSPLESGCGIYSCRVKHVSLQGLYIHKKITETGCFTWIHLTSPGLMCLFAVIIMFIAMATRRSVCKSRTR